MNHSVDVAQGHKACGAEADRMEKGVTRLPPGEGGRSLWVLGELLSCKVASDKTGGALAV